MLVIGESTFSFRTEIEKCSELASAKEIEPFTSQEMTIVTIK